MNKLGKYDIIEKIGEGGFGTVYKAKDPTLDRVVAIKVLKPMLLADPTFIERFRREANPPPHWCIPTSSRFTKWVKTRGCTISPCAI